MPSKRLTKVTRRTFVYGAAQAALSATFPPAIAAADGNTLPHALPPVPPLKKTSGYTLLTPAMLSQLKKSTEEHPRAKEFCDKIIEDALYWISFSDESIYSMMPLENPRTYTPGSMLAVLFTEPPPREPSRRTPLLLRHPINKVNLSFTGDSALLL